MPIPALLSSYFARLTDEDCATRRHLDLGLLPAEDVRRWTETFDFHPLVRDLSGFVLDDPNTSNHHVFASASPLAGMVVFLSHDGDSRAVFPSLDAFLQATREARTRGVPLLDLHPRLSPPAGDQASLSAFIHGLLEDTSKHEIAPFIPSLDLTDTPLVERLVGADAFFAETIASEMAKRR